MACNSVAYNSNNPGKSIRGWLYSIYSYLTFDSVETLFKKIEGGGAGQKDEQRCLPASQPASLSLVVRCRVMDYCDRLSESSVGASPALQQQPRALGELCGPAGIQASGIQVLLRALTALNQ